MMNTVDIRRYGKVTKFKGKARRRNRLTGKSEWKNITMISAAHEDFEGTEFWLENDFGTYTVTFSVEGKEPTAEAIREAEKALFDYYGIE